MRFCALVSAALLVIPSVAAAQSVGLGPRFSLVRGDVEEGTSADRFTGGLLRARLSDHTSLELSLDYRSHSDELLEQRITEYPFQGTLLVYPVQASFAPYLLGGIGWYSQRVEPLVADPEVEEAGVTTRPFGYHAGLGAEIRFGARAAIHLDYRYTFMRRSDEEDGGGGIPGLSFLADQLNVSRDGSMWTGGLTIYF
jgi:hypothetical protein